jgi:hypothetical protein
MLLKRMNQPFEYRQKKGKKTGKKTGFQRMRSGISPAVRFALRRKRLTIELLICLPFCTS